MASQRFWWQEGDGAIRRCAKLQGALQTILLKHGAAENLGELTGGVAADDVHLPEAVLRSDVSLGEDEVFH
jgi:hypothetical protein